MYVKAQTSLPTVRAINNSRSHDFYCLVLASISEVGHEGEYIANDAKRLEAPGGTFKVPQGSTKHLKAPWKRLQKLNFEKNQYIH